MLIRNKKKISKKNFIELYINNKMMICKCLFKEENIIK